MFDKIEGNRPQERVPYVSPNVKEITVKGRTIICQSPYGIPTEFDEENEN